MDDFVLLHPDKAQLHTWRLRCSLFNISSGANR
jgi:hypothetical protein